jgi:hypothetical protein
MFVFDVMAQHGDDSRRVEGQHQAAGNRQDDADGWDRDVGPDVEQREQHGAPEHRNENHEARSITAMHLVDALLESRVPALLTYSRFHISSSTTAVFGFILVCFCGKLISPEECLAKLISCQVTTARTCRTTTFYKAE